MAMFLRQLTESARYGVLFGPVNALLEVDTQYPLCCCQQFKHYNHVQPSPLFYEELI